MNRVVQAHYLGSLTPLGCRCTDVNVFSAALSKRRNRRKLFSECPTKRSKPVTVTDRCLRLLVASQPFYMASTSSSISSLTSSTTSTSPSQTKSSNNTVTVHNVSPVVAFIIGLSIILLASILNAAGLNLTKLDHVG